MTLFRLLPDSRLFIDAKSSLHPIHSEATGLSGEAEVEIVDGRIELDASTRGKLELPVERIRSGNTMQDTEMIRRVDARRFPKIVAELRKATAAPQPDRYRLTADLTFHGVTRRLELEATASLENAEEGNGGMRAVVECQFTLDVRAYDVTPPSFLGLKVFPEVKIRVRLVLEAA